MADAPNEDLLGAAVGPIAQQLSIREQRILLAILERKAAENYRKWGAEEGDPSLTGGFEQAARNEDGIAQILEELDPDYAREEAALTARFPEIDGIFASVLDGRPLEEQLRIQMAAEAGASGIFQSFADAETDPAAKAKLMECASTETSNADFLAGVLGRS